MTGEHSPPSGFGEFDPTGTGQLMQFPEIEGAIPLGVNYRTPGTPIEWETHPFTRTNGEVPTDERKALITAEDGNAYYLRGSGLYDIGRSIASGSLIGASFSEFMPMPGVTIGEVAPFSSGTKIVDVTIATGEVAAGEPESADILDEAVTVPGNPFLRVDALVDTLPPASITSPTLEEKDWGNVVIKRPHYFHTWEWAHHDPRLQEHDPNIEAPLARSYHGIPVAPQMSPAERKNYEYQPRYLEELSFTTKAAAKAAARKTKNKSIELGQEVGRYSAKFARYTGRLAIKGAVKGAEHTKNAAQRTGRAINRGAHKSAEHAVKASKKTAELTSRGAKATARGTKKAAMHVRRAPSHGAAKVRDWRDKRKSP